MTQAPASTRSGAWTGATADERTPIAVWLFLAALVASLFSGFSEELGLPLSPDRPLYLLAIVLVLLDARTEKLRWRWVYGVMILMVLWVTLSLLSTGGLGDSDKVFALFDRVVMPFAMFIMGALAFNTTRTRILLLRTGALIGIYLGISALTERLGLEALIWPKYIIRLHEETDFWRALGPQGQPEALGMTCNLALFMAVLLAKLDKSAWRWIAFAAMPLATVGSVLSMTRSVWVGLLAGVVICGLILPEFRRFVPAVLLAAVALIGAVLILFPSVAEDMLIRLTTGASLYDRINTNNAALRIIAEQPLTGIGWGNFIHDNVLWVRQADTYPLATVTIEVHNVFLARGAETGILGMVLWGLAVLMGPVAVILARPRTQEMAWWKLLALAALLVWFFPTMFSPNPYPLPNILFWLIAGVAGRGILVDLPRAEKRPERVRPN